MVALRIHPIFNIRAEFKKISFNNSVRTFLFPFSSVQWLRGNPCFLRYDGQRNVYVLSTSQCSHLFECICYTGNEPFHVIKQSHVFIRFDFFFIHPIYIRIRFPQGQTNDHVIIQLQLLYSISRSENMNVFHRQY